MDISHYKQHEPLWGSWYITHEIGEGGCGKVFEIERKDEDGRTVCKSALKAITVPSNATELKSAQTDGMDEKSRKSYFYSMVQKFSREFELMCKLKDNRNIVNYEDHVVIAHTQGIGWDILIRMELLTPANDYFRVSENATCYNIIRLGIDMCKALEVCQSHKIIHRDIKPSNIFVNEKGDFKLGDFGVSRVKETTGTDLTKTGTTGYMAPEVYFGRKYSSSVDIYSLGIVLYRLLNYGRLPFLPPMPEAITYEDTESSTDRRLKGENLPAPANGGEELARVVLKACAYNEEERFSSPDEMRRALEKLLPTASNESIAWVDSTNIPTDHNTEETPNTDTITQTTEHPPEPKKRGVKEWLSKQKQKFLIDSTKRKNIWIGLVVIAVVVIIADVALLYNRINKKENISETVNTSESQIYYSDFAAVYEQYSSDIAAAARVYIETKTDKSILGIYCDDFNFNGMNEVFAITGTFNPDDISYENCTVWYANSVSCTEIATEDKIIRYDSGGGKIVSGDGLCLFTYEKYDKGQIEKETATHSENCTKIFSVDSYSDCFNISIIPVTEFDYNAGSFCGYSSSGGLIEFIYSVSKKKFEPLILDGSALEITELLISNEMIWRPNFTLSFDDCAFIDLDGEMPLEFLSINHYYDDNYDDKTLLQFYKIDIEKNTVTKISDIDLNGDFDKKTISVHKDPISGEIVYMMETYLEGTFCCFRMVAGDISYYITNEQAKGFTDLNCTCDWISMNDLWNDYRHLANSYSQFSYDGYGELTVPTYDSMQKAYKKVLAEYFDFEDQGRSGYNLFDINCDGVYELVILAGTCEADYVLYFYTYCENRLIYMGEMVSGHGVLHSVNNGEKLYCISLHMYCEYVTEFNISDYRVYGNTVFEAEHDPSTFTEYEYEDFEGYMEMQAFSDFSLLDNTQTFVEKADDVELTTEKETQKRGGLFSGLFG